MTPLASVLVPYRPDGDMRDAAWDWVVRPSWEALDVEILVESPGPGVHPGEFNHPAAINAARRRATSDVLIVADADTWWAPTRFVEQAVDLVRTGVASWVLPEEYWQLGERQTNLLLGGDPWDVADLADWIGFGSAWSGVVVVHREAFDRVGGYDERWTHWGSDDAAFAVTMTNLVEPVTRVPGSRALHLWHPRAVADVHADADQKALMGRYFAADGNADAVAAVRFEHWKEGQTLG